MSDRILRGALGAALLVALGACSEQVTGSLGCPTLCSDQSATLRDTVLIGVVELDSTLTGFPLLGSTRELSLVSRGDTADVRVVARFDTLPATYRPVGAAADSAITRVDSASLIFHIDTAFTKPRVAVTIEAYDVDSTAADTVPRTLLPLFRADRLIGSTTYQPADLKDTMKLALSNGAILNKIANAKRLRIGLRVRAAESATIRLSGTSFQPRVRFRVSADTSVAPDTVFPTSRTPTGNSTIAAGLLFYPIVAAGQLPPPPSDRLAIGGIAGARSYIRFDIPRIVLDSVQVIRAALQLDQIPSRSAGGDKDTLTLITQAVVAAPSVRDVFTQLQFLSAPGTFGIDTLRLRPSQGGRRSVEMVNLVRAWQAVGTTNTTRAIALRGEQEASSPGELNFLSTRGPAGVGPRLRLTYVPRRGFGIP